MTSTHSAAPKILYEDDVLLVLDKPAGLVVHPAPSHHGLTLIDWIRDYLGPEAAKQFSEPERLGLVHRLDKDTSGVLVVTKSALAKTDLGRQFHDRLVKKQYVAFIEGIPPRKTGLISAPIGRSRKVPSRMAVTGTGRASETSFEVAEKFKEVSLVNLYPKTGRTHQLRVHCAAIGHPIVGDHTYGSKAKWSTDYGIHRPLLHAKSLELTHPVTGKRVEFEAPWPPDMKKALTVFRRTLKMAFVLAFVASVVCAAPSDNTPVAKTPVKRKTSSEATSSVSSTKALKREMGSLHEQFKALIEEVSALQDRVTGIQSSLDELAASRRLRDLEKAISDLNAKSVATSSTSEEAKTQVLDMSRKLKEQQDVLDQLRDQVDRLKQDLIQVKARQETPPAPAAQTK